MQPFLLYLSVVCCSSLLLTCLVCLFLLSQFVVSLQLTQLVCLLVLCLFVAFPVFFSLLGSSSLPVSTFFVIVFILAITHLDLAFLVDHALIISWIRGCFSALAAILVGNSAVAT